MNSDTLLLLSSWSPQLYIIYIVPEASNTAVIINIVIPANIVWLLAVILIIDFDFGVATMIKIESISFLMLFDTFLQCGMHIGQDLIRLDYSRKSVLHVS